MMARTVLVPLDFSECSLRALDYACSLSEKLGATVHVVTALGAGLPELSLALTDSVIESMRTRAQEQLAKVMKAREGLAKLGRGIVEIGDARDGILHAAVETGADLIVIGSHGRRGVTRLVLGSVAEDIVRRAPCPVLVVRMKEPS